MSTDTEKTKKIRRGISNQTQAVSQLKFHEKDAAPNKLFLGHLAEVKVEWSVGSENSSFNGVKMPRLVFHFASNHTNNAEVRHLYHTLFPIESNVSTIPGGESDWRVNSLLRFIKHILDTFYLKNRNLTEQEEELLVLDINDTDENGEYVPVEPEDVCKAYATLFNNIVDMLEGKINCPEGETPKCCYKDANGKCIVVWMKLLRHRRTKNGWVNIATNGELGFDSFVGNGFLEIAKANIPPAVLYVDIAKESIVPQETKKAPTIGAPGVLGMPTMGDGMTYTGGNNFNDAFVKADDDLPF